MWSISTIVHTNWTFQRLPKQFVRRDFSLEVEPILPQHIYSSFHQYIIYYCFYDFFFFSSPYWLVGPQVLAVPFKKRAGAACETLSNPLLPSLCKMRTPDNSSLLHLSVPCRSLWWLLSTPNYHVSLFYSITLPGLKLFWSANVEFLTISTSLFFSSSFWTHLFPVSSLDHQLLNVTLLLYPISSLPLKTVQTMQTLPWVPR